MLGFITNNLGSIIIGLLLLGIILLVIRSIRKDKKEGKSCGSCPGGCGGCASEEICHAEKIGVKREERKTDVDAK